MGKRTEGNYPIDDRIEKFPKDKSLMKVWLCIIQSGARMFVHCKHEASYPASRTVFCASLRGCQILHNFTSTGAGMYKSPEEEDTLGSSY